MGHNVCVKNLLSFWELSYLFSYDIKNTFFDTILQTLPTSYCHLSLSSIIKPRTRFSFTCVVFSEFIPSLRQRGEDIVCVSVGHYSPCICDTQPRKVHKVAGSERRSTPKKVV